MVSAMRQEDGSYRTEKAFETADVWRVYRPEWVVVHTVRASDQGLEYPKAAAEIALALCAYRDQQYLGRVRKDDARYVFTGAGETMAGYLELRMPAMRGEFRDRDDANEHVLRNGWTDAVIVSRNSRQDHELRGYGTHLIE